VLELDATPPVPDGVLAAIRETLAETHATTVEQPAWLRAALTDAVDRDESYAPSPRSTRGATRA
jgi:hypothetical protein